MLKSRKFFVHHCGSGVTHLSNGRPLNFGTHRPEPVGEVLDRCADDFQVAHERRPQCLICRRLEPKRSLLDDVCLTDYGQRSSWHSGIDLGSFVKRLKVVEKCLHALVADREALCQRHRRSCFRNTLLHLFHTLCPRTI